LIAHVRFIIHKKGIYASLGEGPLSKNPVITMYTSQQKQIILAVRARNAFSLWIVKEWDNGIS
jgi:hypothetical protein